MTNRWVGAALWSSAVVLAVGAGTGVASAAGSNAAKTQTLKVAGGTVGVQCSGTTAKLVHWSPKAGFRADDAVRGPAARVGIRFENDATDNDVTVTVRCVKGKAVASTKIGDDHGRGGRDNGTPAPAATATSDDHGRDKGGDNDGDKAKGGHDAVDKDRAGHDAGDIDKTDRDMADRDKNGRDKADHDKNDDKGGHGKDDHDKNDH